MKLLLSLVLLLTLSTAQASGLGSLFQLIEIFGKKSAQQAPAQKFKYRPINIRPDFANDTHKVGIEFRMFDTPRKPVDVEVRPSHVHIDLAEQTKKNVAQTEPKLVKLEMMVLELEESSPIQIQKLLSEVAPAFGMAHEVIKGTAKENRDPQLVLKHKANAETLFDILTKGLDHNRAGMRKDQFQKARSILLGYAMDALNL